MEPGDHIGHYRIVSRLGAGGMGEVYLAHDERLERPAAVKILPLGSTTDRDQIRRFTQEAKAAAALSHPNIAHIYDAGEEGGIPYLAMEYVEGSTLNHLITPDPLTPEENMQVALQVADALDEAHRKGIIHRDIKPSNLIRNGRGQVKVLDFGLAKLSAAAKLQLAGTVSGTNTDSGSLTQGVVGSLPYMSPEQALGKDLDHRTDIFSFGAVLYEMATARRAFPGTTPAAVFDAILNRSPVAPRLLNPQIPDGLDRVIRKSLEKDPSLRYQTASDLLADLRLVQRDQRDSTTAQLANNTGTGQQSAPRQSIGVRIGVAALAVIGSASIGWYLANVNRPEPPRDLRIVPLTSFPGSEQMPSFSPDGNQVVFSWNQGKEDDLDLYVKVVEAGSPLRLTNTPASEHSPAWSPDGRYIAFLRQSLDTAGFYLIPALGGPERKVTDASPARVGADAPFCAWTPDGKQLAIVDRSSASEPLSIFLVDPNTGQRKRLTTPPAGSVGDSTLSFSKDGQSLAFVRTSSLTVQDIYIVSLKDSTVRRLTNDGRRLYGLVWDWAGDRLVFTSTRDSSSRVWRVSPGGGPPERIPGIADQAGFLAMSRSGTRLAYSRSSLDTNIWRYQLPEHFVATPTGSAVMSSTRYEQGPRYSPDGSKIVFSSNRSGSLEIWTANAEGAELNQITNFGGATGSPMWSPDGRWIVFDSRPGGNPDVYIVGVDGGTPRRLTTDPSDEIVPSFSRDGAWVYFASNRTGHFELWKMPTAGGTAVQVTHNGGFHGVETPDGKFVYYAKGSNIGELWRVPVNGGQEEAILRELRPGYWSYWSLGKDGIYYVDREELPGGGARYPLHFFELATKKNTVLTNLSKRPFNSGLSVSPDGKWFLYTQADSSEVDIMLVDGFR